MRRREFCRRFAFSAVASSSLLGCREGRRQPIETDQLHIVSLSPAISQTLVEIGLADAVVAVGDGDDFFPGLPSVGRFVDLDLEQLISLEPTHVLAMTGRQGLPDAIERLASRHAFELRSLEYPQDVSGCIASIVEVGSSVGRLAAGQRLAQRVAEDIEAIAGLTKSLDPVSTLVIFNDTPLMAAGPGTVLDELLSVAGGRNAAEGFATTAPTLDQEALIAIDPEVIVWLQPRAKGDSGQKADLRLGAASRVAAVQNQRVYRIEDRAVLLPGPSIGRTAGSLAGVIHPDLQQPISEILNAVR